MKKPILIIIDGPMGSGKSTVAELLHKKIPGKTALISLDKLKRIVSEYKMDSLEHLELAAKSGAAMADTYLKDGINVIVEKAFTMEQYLRAFLKLIKTKPRIFIYQMEIPFELGILRVKERERLKEKGIPKNKIKEKVTRNYKHFIESRYKDAKVFDSSKLTPRQIINKIIKDLK